jgi:hypothetical protein
VGLLNQPHRISDFSSAGVLGIRGCALAKVIASNKLVASLIFISITS